MTVAPGAPGPTDAELVGRVLSGDREAFAVVYDRYGPRLYDFAHSMLRHREDAADAVADSFVLFAEKLAQLRDPDRLRPWLYAIVRSECLRRLKARKRVAYGDDEQLVAMADDAVGPDRSAEVEELRRLVWDASAGLADRDRALLDLHLRQGLEGAELGEAVGVSANNAYVMLNRLRAQVDRSLGALLIARLGRDGCAELDGLLAEWDGSFSPLVRKRVARHVDGCDRCSERRRRMVSPWVLLAGVPVFAAPVGLRDRVLGDSRLVAAHPGEDVEWLDTGAPAGTGGHRWGAGRFTLAAVTLLVLVIGATVLLWPGSDDGVVPAEADPTASATTPAATPPATPAPTAAATKSAPAGRGSPAGSPTVVAAPGSLTVSTRSLSLGTTASQAAFDLANVGELPTTYTVSARSRWLGVAPIGGTLPGGAQGRVLLGVDRSSLPEGRSSTQVVVTWDGGRVTVRVSVDQERPPVVGAPAVPAGSSCDVTVTVRATDPSGVAAVRLAWTGPGGAGTTRMTRSGADWSAVVHVTVGGSYDFAATATDTRGNAATGPTRTTLVDPCPQ